MDNSRRIAKIALGLYSAEQEFAYSCPTLQEANLLKLAFEEMGCTVELHPHKNELLVKCPQGLAAD